MVSAMEPPGPLAVSVDEAGRLLGISRDLVYDMVARRELVAVRLGRRIVIPVRALRDILGQTEEEVDGEPGRGRHLDHK